MGIRLGDTAPNFNAETTEGTIDFHEWKGDDWVILFSHPADYTPVCTTELGRAAGLKPEFDRRNVKLLGISVDPLEDHRGWSSDIQDVTGNALNFPLIADEGGEVANLYDMLHPGEGDSSTVRVVFVIDGANKVRLMLTYPKSVGRNFDEIVRAVDALQLTDKAPVSTPADWEPGQDVIAAPTLSDEEVKERLGEYEKQKDYLRTVKAPS